MEFAYLSCEEVAKMTGKAAGTVRKWCRTGVLKASKPTGKDYLIKREDFEAFMNADNRT